MGVSDSTAKRAIDRCLPLLEAAGQDTMRMPDPGRGRRTGGHWPRRRPRPARVTRCRPGVFSPASAIACQPACPASAQPEVPGCRKRGGRFLSSAKAAGTRSSSAAVAAPTLATNIPRPTSARNSRRVRSMNQ
ncbi:MAG TPA: hypothetical protein VN688_14765 [Gemmataceae bacterium]|nr:hypothetical protein [Gemmataceae bacterium]